MKAYCEEQELYTNLFNTTKILLMISENEMVIYKIDKNTKFIYKWKVYFLSDLKLGSYNIKTRIGGRISGLMGLIGLSLVGVME